MEGLTCLLNQNNTDHQSNSFLTAGGTRDVKINSASGCVANEQESQDEDRLTMKLEESIVKSHYKTGQK